MSFLLLSFSVSLLSAQPPQNNTEVMNCVAEISPLLRKQFQARLLKMNQNRIEKTGTSVNYRMSLQKNNIYVFAVCGESSFGNIDIRIYNPDQYLAAKDQKNSSTPVVSYQPETDGLYIIEVRSTKGQGAFTLIMMGK